VLLPDLVTMNPLSNHGHPPFTDVSIPSDNAEARRVQEEIEKQLQTRRASEQEIFSVRLALEEALVNAI
jgi:serine/threonine-protein kinase RsbW